MSIDAEIEKVKCGICKDVAKKVCILLPDNKALVCLGNVESFSTDGADWKKNIASLRALGVFDKVVDAYAERVGKPAELIRRMFESVEKGAVL